VPRYQIKQKFISLGQDFDVLDESGRPAFKIDGHFITMCGKKFDIIDLTSNDKIGYAKKRICWRIKPTFDMQLRGKPYLTFSKAWFTFFRPKYKAKTVNGETYVIQGNFLEKNYTVRKNGGEVAKISKTWVALRDCYGVEVISEENPVIPLAFAVMIDLLLDEKTASPSN
jgi:uncharacterized protein YxjI